MSDPAPVPAGGWRRFAVAAYGPTTLASVGHGAIAPLVALSALDMGASLEVSALVTGLSGLGQLLFDLPASWVATRLGDKRAIVLACLWDAVFLVLAFSATSLPLLCLAVFAFGPAMSVFGLARQSYITDAVPIYYRARALSTLGGTFRIGTFIGPLAGSAIVASWNLSAAYAFAAVMALFAAGVTLTLPDLPGERRRRDRNTEAGLFAVLWRHRGVLVKLGSGVLVLAMLRAARQSILPLWCDSIGLNASGTSLVFAASMAVDMSLFFLGGSIMDRFGRFWVAVPSMIILGLGFAGLALTWNVVTVVVAAVILGIGNGVGAGIVMVLGSDASPVVGRPQFLSGWRLMGDLGNTLGPAAISGLVLVASLGLAAIALGIIAWAGAAWLGYGIRHNPPPVGA